MVLRLPLLDLPTDMQSFENTYALVWTTTPWTLPSNQAVCYNPDMEYSLVTLSGDLGNHYLLGSKLIKEFESMTGLEVVEVLKTLGEYFNSSADVYEANACLLGDSLKDCTYLHPIDKNQRLPFLAGAHVQDTKGTGLVHTAPAHGPEDFLISLEHKMPVVGLHLVSFNLVSCRS